MTGKSLVVLVNEHDQEIGTMEKMRAHQSGVLHRAFSVFIFNEKNELLLQQRAVNKYHSGGLWTNSCCSHPMPGENIKQAAIRRLQEEMGISCPDLKFLLTQVYKADLDNNLIEHELDHVFVGYCNDMPITNKDEVMNYKFVSIDFLKEDIKNNPRAYTVWFTLLFPKVAEAINT